MVVKNRFCFLKDLSSSLDRNTSGANLSQTLIITCLIKLNFTKNKEHNPIVNQNIFLVIVLNLYTNWAVLLCFFGNQRNKVLGADRSCFFRFVF
jgi:hypothetical protein